MWRVTTVLVQNEGSYYTATVYIRALGLLSSISRQPGCSKNIPSFLRQALRASTGLRFLMCRQLDIAKLSPHCIYGLPPHPLSHTSFKLVGKPFKGNLGHKKSPSHLQ